MSLALSRRYSATYRSTARSIRAVTSLSPRPILTRPSRIRARQAHIESSSHPTTEAPPPIPIATRGPPPIPEFLQRHEEHFPSGAVVFMIFFGPSALSRILPVDPKSRYKELVAHGTLREDDHQKYIIGKLQNLHDQLKTYNPPLIPEPSHSMSVVSHISDLL